MSIKILCIEDNKDNMTLITRLLQAGPYELIQARNGEQGVQLAEQEHVDIILLDINLPDIDGYEVARRLRNSIKRPALANVPVVAITANAMRGDDLKAIQAGCTHYMTKPINISKFIECIEMISGAVDV